MRPIDADKLKAGFIGKRYGVQAIEYVIDKQPTVDAIPVVRCKDCKKYIPCQKLPIGTSKWCDLFDRATCEMNYCGWGERRTDGTD